MLSVQARIFEGVRENTDRHKLICDIYNSQKDLPRGYKIKYTDSWCACFVSVCAILSGVNIPREVSASKMYENLIKKGFKNVKIPYCNDIVFFQNSNCHICHVGIVESVCVGIDSVDFITVIEGNSKNKVSINKYDLNCPRIAHFIRI